MAIDFAVETLPGMALHDALDALRSEAPVAPVLFGVRLC